MDLWLNDGLVIGYWIWIWIWIPWLGEVEDIYGEREGRIDRRMDNHAFIFLDGWIGGIVGPIH